MQLAVSDSLTIIVWVASPASTQAKVLSYTAPSCKGAGLSRCDTDSVDGQLEPRTGRCSMQAAARCCASPSMVLSKRRDWQQKTSSPSARGPNGSTAWPDKVCVCVACTKQNTQACTGTPYMRGVLGYTSSSRHLVSQYGQTQLTDILTLAGSIACECLHIVEA